MKYQEIPEFNEVEVLKNLESNSEEIKSLALLSIVLNSSNYELAMAKSLTIAAHESPKLKAIAIECFGHIARLYNTLDLEKVMAILKNNQNSDDKFLQGKVQNSIEDISVFLKISKRKLLK